MAGIVEARHRPAILLSPTIECFGFGAPHVGLKSTEPEQAGIATLPGTYGNTARRATAYFEQGTPVLPGGTGHAIVLSFTLLFEGSTHNPSTSPFEGALLPLRNHALHSIWGWP